MFTQMIDRVRFPPDVVWSGRWGVYGHGLPLGLVLTAVVVAGLVAAVIVLSVRLARRGRRAGESIEIVKARYARGEISKAEFEELKKDLS